MCGIAGFVESVGDARRSEERAALLDRMCRSIEHRGPDEQGAEVLGRAAIGMRRLSIIDLAGGQQPMSGCDARVRLVFNGEIYNFKELQRDLEARGHKFRTRSDTEAIVHAYEDFAGVLAQLGERGSPRMAAALAWLERAQEADGSWFGRWGVNYV